MCPPEAAPGPMGAPWRPPAGPPGSTRSPPRRGRRSGRHRPNGCPPPARCLAAPPRARRVPRATPRSAHPDPGVVAGGTGGGQIVSSTSAATTSRVPGHARRFERRPGLRGAASGLAPSTARSAASRSWLTGSPGPNTSARTRARRTCAREAFRSTRELDQEPALADAWRRDDHLGRRGVALRRSSQRCLKPRDIFRPPEQRSTERPERLFA